MYKYNQDLNICSNYLTRIFLKSVAIHYLKEFSKDYYEETNLSLTYSTRSRGSKLYQKQCDDVTLGTICHKNMFSKILIPLPKPISRIYQSDSPTVLETILYDFVNFGTFSHNIIYYKRFHPTKQISTIFRSASTKLITGYLGSMMSPRKR